MNIENYLPQINAILAENPCPKHHSVCHAEIKRGKPKVVGACCREQELKCAKLLASFLLEKAHRLKL